MSRNRATLQGGPSDAPQSPLRPYILACSTLMLPAIVTLLLGTHRRLVPLVNVSYVLAVAGAGWNAGGVAATIIAFTCIPLITVITSGGHRLVPSSLDPAQLAVLILVGMLSSIVAKARHRSEEMLRKANFDLETKVSERTLELQQRNQELQRANADLEQFAYSVSHDLQEPLRMVSIYTQLLERDYGSRLDGKAKLYIDVAIRGAASMRELLKDLLAYIQLADEPGDPVPLVSAERAFEQVIGTLRATIEASHAQITSDHLPYLPMHAVHLEQLFYNLIGNALKYRSSDAPRIHISSLQRDNEWVISVRDNGIGIAPQYTSQVFGIFKRLHTRAEYDGTGIGLALCQKVVERYGGRIWVESQLGAGSTFSFSIPGRGDGQKI